MPADLSPACPRSLLWAHSLKLECSKIMERLQTIEKSYVTTVEFHESMTSMQSALHETSSSNANKFSHLTDELATLRDQTTKLSDAHDEASKKADGMVQQMAELQSKGNEHEAMTGLDESISELKDRLFALENRVDNDAADRDMENAGNHNLMQRVYGIEGYLRYVDAFLRQQNHRASDDGIPKLHEKLENLQQRVSQLEEVDRSGHHSLQQQASSDGQALGGQQIVPLEPLQGDKQDEAAHLEIEPPQQVQEPKVQDPESVAVPTVVEPSQNKEQDTQTSEKRVRRGSRRTCPYPLTQRVTRSMKKAPVV